MKDIAGGASPLSLQDKLDRISHDRDVLAQLRDLARKGLHDGDAVRHRDSGACGRDTPPICRREGCASSNSGLSAKRSN